MSDNKKSLRLMPIRHDGGGWVKMPVDLIGALIPYLSLGGLGVLLHLVNEAEKTGNLRQTIGNRELADLFGVSRSNVNTQINKLVDMGALKRGRRGVFTREAKDLRPDEFDLVDVRVVLERLIVEHLAKQTVRTQRRRDQEAASKAKARAKQAGKEKSTAGAAPTASSAPERVTIIPKSAAWAAFAARMAAPVPNKAPANGDGLDSMTRQELVALAGTMGLAESARGLKPDDLRKLIIEARTEAA